MIGSRFFVIGLLMLWSIMPTLFKMFVSVLGFIFNVWISVQVNNEILGQRMCLAIS